MGLSLGRHPVAFLRPTLAARFQSRPFAELQHYPHGRLARASGLVTHRQRPSTAKGILFLTLEDETGRINVVIWPDVWSATNRPPCMANSSPSMGAGNATNASHQGPQARS